MKRLGEGIYTGKKEELLNTDELYIALNNFENGFENEWHYHENSFLAFLINGYCIEKRKTRTFECSPGNILIFNKHEVHRDKILKAKTKTFSVEFKDPWFAKYPAAKYGELNIQMVNKSFIQDTFIKIFRECNDMDGYSLLSIEGLILHLTAQIGKETINKRSAVPGWIKRFKEMEFCSDEKITLTGLAKILNIHPVTLSREFFRYFKCSFGEYIRQRKIEKAVSLLYIKHKSISDISIECGFCDASHFIKAFRRTMHISPAEYRKTIFR